MTTHISVYKSTSKESTKIYSETTASFSTLIHIPTTPMPKYGTTGIVYSKSKTNRGYLDPTTTLSTSTLFYLPTIPTEPTTKLYPESVKTTTFTEGTKYPDTTRSTTRGTSRYYIITDSPELKTVTAPKVTSTTKSTTHSMKWAWKKR